MKIVEGKIKINKADIILSGNLADGIYTAKMSNDNDRIVFVVNGKIIMQLNEAGGSICLQDGASGFNTYSNYRLVKKLELKVTL